MCDRPISLAKELLRNKVNMLTKLEFVIGLGFDSVESTNTAPGFAFRRISSNARADALFSTVSHLILGSVFARKNFSRFHTKSSITNCVAAARSLRRTTRRKKTKPRQRRFQSIDQMLITVDYRDFSNLLKMHTTCSSIINS